jgi:hypothetical protein
MLYKEKSLRYSVPQDVLKIMSEKAKNKLFNKKYFRGRKVLHYDYRVEKGVVRLDSSTKYLPKRRPGQKHYWTYGGVVRKEIRDCLLIKPSRTCLFKGVTPFPLGSQPQKVKYVNKKFYQFLTADPESAALYDPIYHDRVSVSGSWGSQYPDFQKLCDPVSHEVTYEDYCNTIKRDGHLLRLPQLSAPTIDDIRFVKTNSRASSGLLTSKLFGQKHAQSDTYNFPLAEQLFIRTGLGDCCDTSCWFIGGRNRRQKLHVDKILRSRSLLVPEGAPKVFGLLYAQRVYDAFANINWKDYRSEIRLGNNEFHGNYLGYDAYMGKENATYVEADISCHDGNTSEAALVCAFGILRSMFPPSVVIDRHFQYFMSGFIFKNVAVPGRFIYRVLKGIPTGSPFTSIIVSLVNWLNWRTWLYKEGFSYRTVNVLHVFGDDTLIRFDDIPDDLLHKCNEDYWIRSFKQYIGHDLDPVHFKHWTHDRDTAPTFLKTYSFFGLPARHYLDSILSATIVRKSNERDVKYANMVKGLMYAGPFDFRGMRFLERFRSFLLRRASYPVDMLENDSGLSEREITARVNTTYRGVTKVYLLPIVPNYDIIKNVDLGNKPKTFAYRTYYDINIVKRMFTKPILYRMASNRSLARRAA